MRPHFSAQVVGERQPGFHHGGFGARGPLTDTSTAATSCIARLRGRRFPGARHRGGSDLGPIGGRPLQVGRDLVECADGQPPISSAVMSPTGRPRTSSAGSCETALSLKSYATPARARFAIQFDREARPGAHTGNRLSSEGFPTYLSHPINRGGCGRRFRSTACLYRPSGGR